MSRPWHVWSAFAACLTLVAIALGWLTYRAVELDRAEANGREQAALEENARLALWRMDTAMASLVAQESAMPYFAYRPFFPAQLPTTSKIASEEATTPSPLLMEATPLVRLHFQVDSNGAVTSPRVPVGRSRQLAVPRFISVEQLAEGERLLDEIGRKIQPAALLARLPTAAAGTIPPPLSIPENVPQTKNTFGMQQEVNAAPEVQDAQRRARSSDEYLARSQYLSQNNTRVQQGSKGNSLNLPNTILPAISPADGQTAVMTPLWLDGELLLARKVVIDGLPCVQACWLDLPAIRKQLLESVDNILPAAQLRAATGDEPSHKLASLPLEVVPGPAPTLVYASLTPMQLALLTSWTAFGIAAIAVALVLLGVVSLSERRAAFVSAVTHELRTPLTTFRLYSEMLAEGMVPDEASRAKYLSTLRTEADRLMHLVENVLAYARLERGRIDKRTAPVAVRELVDRSFSRLAARAEEAGLSLVVEGDEAALSAKALADPTAVEQVLFNLVDNASKYAASATDHRLTLKASQTDGWIVISLHDHGKGIAQAERRRLFRPFHKSAEDAALSAPGVGLGLALSRRLARAMGGDLKLDDAPDGARFFACAEGVRPISVVFTLRVKVFSRSLKTTPPNSSMAETMKKLRFGILSTAKIGTAKVIPAMQRGKRTEVTAIASRSLDTAKAAAKSLGIPTCFGSYEELLASPEIDAVYNPLPNHLHVPLSIKALEAGKHVLCEKPIGLTAAEGQKLVDAASKHPHLKVMEAFMYRHHPQWQRAKEIVRNGGIGKMRTIQTFFSYYNDDADNIRNQPEIGGGALLDIGCYCVSLSRFLCDAEPVRVFGAIEYHSRFGTDVVSSGILDFGAVSSTFTCGTLLAPYQRVHIAGTTGHVEIEIPFNAPPDRPCRIWHRTASGDEEILLPTCDQYTIQGDLFAAAVLDDTAVPTPISDAVSNMLAIEAIVRSAKAGAWQTLAHE